MAKASGDRGFGGYVIALLTNQALYLGRNRQVIQYAETALRGARGSLSPALVTDLNSLQAKAYARIGDRDGCHAAMTRAEERRHAHPARPGTSGDQLRAGRAWSRPSTPTRCGPSAT